MSVLAFTTAPWVVGTLYLGVQRRVSWAHVYIAICLWLFSASWSYDLYLVIRDGAYPNTWLANLFASSVLYMRWGLSKHLACQPVRLFGPLHLCRVAVEPRVERGPGCGFWVYATQLARAGFHCGIPQDLLVCVTLHAHRGSNDPLFPLSATGPGHRRSAQ
jgi:hypothetical protein